MVEKFLHWFGEIHGMRSICLRYFNASGADPAGRTGEDHEPETHLIPLLFRAIQTGNPITIFGDDYPTPDGTCIRDYIHVTDLARAHISAVEAFGAERVSNPLTTPGTGHGFLGERVLQRRRTSDWTESPLRHGTAPRLAIRPNSSLIPPAFSGTSAEESRKYSDIHTIIDTAWKWF